MLKKQKPEEKKTAVKSGIAGSAEQEAIWEEAKNGKKHIVVNATAGSGKTFTGIEICKRDKKSSMAYVAFNKHIKDELARKLEGHNNVETLTYHGLGFKALRAHLRKVEVDQNKLDKIMDDVIDEPNLGLKGYLFARTRKLVSLAKQYGVGERADLEKLVDHHGIELPGIENRVYDLVPMIMKSCREELATIDFDDMIWLPGELNVRMPYYDVMLVDEAQDTSMAQQAMALKAADRLIVVGDRNQAIYGFRGSDTQSIDRMRDALAATKRGVIEMPLSYTRRCPQSHVALAQRVVPHIKALDTAPDGIVRIASGQEAQGQMKPGDLVLCRVNAPLLGVAYNLIKRGVKAVVRGRDIGDGVIKLMEAAQKKAKTDDIREVLSAAREITEIACQKYRAMPNDRGAGRVQALEDKIDCLMSVSEEAKTVEEVKARILKIFSDFQDDGKPNYAVVLGTVHRTKGLEANRVFVLCPELIPHPMSKKDWMRRQEFNLAYVGVTRAVYNENGPGELVFVGGIPKMFAQ